MNKRGNYNNTPTERGCCHQPEPVLFSSPEKIRTGNENAIDFDHNRKGFKRMLNHDTPL